MTMSTFCGCRRSHYSYWDDDYRYDPEGRVLGMTDEDVRKLSTESLKEVLKLAEAQGKSSWTSIITEVLKERESK